jgi:membrane fusion protein (multidrug efflux system)
MRKPVLLVALPLVALAAVAAGLHWYAYGRFFETTDDAYVQSDITTVSPKVEGYVREIRVVENQHVAAGDVLVVIEDRDFAARLAQAEAAVEASKAALVSLDSRLVWQQSMIDQASAAVGSAEAEERRAAQDWTRYKNLVSSDYASRQRTEQAEADARKAAASLVRARAALAAEKNQLGVVAAQKGEEKARLHQAEAAAVLARHALDDTVIRAAVDGIVGNKGVQLGQYVKVGTQLLALVPLPEIYVTANFKETQLAHMRVGQPVELAIDALPDRKVRGRVESFAPATGAKFSLLPPENATGNFTKIVQRVPVRIAIPAEARADGAIRPGLSVIVSVDTRGEGRGTGSLARFFGGAIPTAQAKGD